MLRDDDRRYLDEAGAMNDGYGKDTDEQEARLGQIREQKRAMAMTGGGELINRQQPCPSCGHCPTCGRGRQYPSTYYPPTYYPWWNGNTWWGQTTYTPGTLRIGGDTVASGSIQAGSASQHDNDMARFAQTTAWNHAVPDDRYEARAQFDVCAHPGTEASE